MALFDDLTTFVKDSFKRQWAVRNGITVPDTENVPAGNVAVEFERATVLYADLNGSTKMVNDQKWDFAAEVYKNFLYCCARLIRAEGGEVTAYDGDRVMGIFLGEVQSTPAAKCALKIAYATQAIVADAMKAQYPQNTFELRHVVGIDTSKIRAAKTGVRGDNDLVWVGRAANYAAKLTDINTNYTTWITADVFSKLMDEAKYSSGEKKLMWVKHNWTQMNNMEVYGSTWRWKIDT